MHIAMTQYGGRSDKVAGIYSMRGQLFIERMLFESALDDYQKMLNALIPEFQSSDYRNIPEVQYENPYFKYIIAANFNKG